MILKAHKIMKKDFRKLIKKLFLFWFIDLKKIVNVTDDCSMGKLERIHEFVYYVITKGNSDQIFEKNTENIIDPRLISFILDNILNIELKTNIVDGSTIVFSALLSEAYKANNEGTISPFAKEVLDYSCRAKKDNTIFSLERTKPINFEKRVIHVCF